jgi:CRP-like cAMP-binding protein
MGQISFSDAEYRQHPADDLSREPGNGVESSKLTHEPLAAMAGVSRQTTSKVVHEFRELGLIAMQSAG